MNLFSWELREKNIKMTISFGPITSKDCLGVQYPELSFMADSSGNWHSHFEENMMTFNKMKDAHSM